MSPRAPALILVAALLSGGEQPVWFTAPVESAQRLEGRGSGADAEAARVAALADLIDQIVVTVADARSLTLVTASTGERTEIREDFRQVLRSSSALRDLAGAEVLRREQVGDRWFLAVGIDRQALARQLAARLADLDGRLSRGLGERPAKPTAAWVATMRELLAAAREREAFAAAATAQGLAVAPNPLPPQTVRLHLGGLAEPALLALESAATAPGSAAGLRSAAPDLGIGLVEDASQARWQIRLAEQRTDTTTSRGWNKVVLRGTATISELRSGAVVGVLDADATATSTVSADEAARLASTALATRLADVARDRLLLILLRNRTDGVAP
jgi:hypothetical protein